MRISVLCSDLNHPVNTHLKNWKNFHHNNHDIEIFQSRLQLTGGDILFLVSCSEIITSQDRSKYRAALVLHASDLPNGRGWSPCIWEIVGGGEEIAASIIEAEDKVDAGKIWSQIKFKVPKHALWNEINDLLFDAEIKLMDFAIDHINDVNSKEQDELTEVKAYRKRDPEDSRIDPKKTIADQFDLIRVADPVRYPCFFEHLGYRYSLKIEKAASKEQESQQGLKKQSRQAPVLIVAAHPDDEVLGCGGTIAKLADTGVPVHVVFLADGVHSRGGESNAQELEARRQAAVKACEILGVSSVSFRDFPDNCMDTVPLLDITRTVEHYLHEYQPSAVFTHHGGDVNIDHRRTFEAVTVACRPQMGNTVKSILSFEVPSSTEWQLTGNALAFVPNWFVDISATLGRKMAALQAYEFEMRDWPHPRSYQGVEHLAKWRGATVGAEAAEAFVLGRQLA